jgi:FkbM family methyltransferase
VVLIKLFSKEFLKNYDFEVGFFGFRYKGNTANLLDRKVLFSGCHECDAIAFLRDAIMADENAIFVDVGANSGHHALFMSKYAKKVYAFEPYAPVRLQMESKISVNHIDNIYVLPTALGEKNELKQYYAPPDENTAIGSFLEGFSSRNIGGEMLEVRCADDVFKELDLDRIDIIKIDVEGFEKSVLSGAKESLKKFNPVVMFECSMDMEGGFQNYDDISASFPGGYTLYRLSHSGKRRHGKYALQKLTPDIVQNKAQFNLVAVPKGRKIPLEAKGRLKK